jgi:hypothetical protein
MSEMVLKQVSELPHLPTAALKERWRILYGREPPANNREYLVRRLAYRIQELAFGGLKDETRERLRQAAQDDNPGGRTGRARRRRRRLDGIPMLGTRLVREWNGGRYEVTVVREGFEHQGRVYRSLSAVAKTITGSHLSGRAFFGVARPRNGKRGDE